MNTVKDRLKAFVKHLNLSEGKFETATGLSKGAVSNVGDSVTTKTLNKISAIFPELNTAWLLTGVGNMIVNSTNTITTEKKMVNEEGANIPKEYTHADRAVEAVNRDWIIRLVAQVYQMPTDKAKALLDNDTSLELDRLLKSS